MLRVLECPCALRYVYINLQLIKFVMLYILVCAEICWSFLVFTFTLYTDLIAIVKED